MPRIQLMVYTSPGEVDVYCGLQFNDGTYERLTAVVDTGAAISLFPSQLLENDERSQAESKRVTIDQAGIDKQSFEAIEGTVTVTLEDASGNVTQPLTIPAWFTDTDRVLLGFAGVLDRSVLHVDMPQQTGWIEINT
jgi:hypothetical protein